MTLEFLERVRRDYEKEFTQMNWDSYLAGYWAAVKRFGEKRETKSKLGNI